MAAEPLPVGLTPGGRFAQWRPPIDVAYVVCDVDGTLVGPGALASDVVVDAVTRAHDAGVRFGLATGRMRDAVTGLRAQLTTTGPHLLHNGAEIVDGADEVLIDWTLSTGQIDTILGLAAQHPDGVLEIYTRHGYVSSSRDRRAAGHWEIIGAEPRAIVTDATQLAGETVLKATYTAFTSEAAASMLGAVTAAGLNAGAAVSPHTPTLTYVNVTHPDANKGRALEAATTQLGLDLAAVVAIGDAGNDVPMLARAGTAIAMGQAPPHVRGAAHLVVGGVDSDGVVAAIDAAMLWRTDGVGLSRTGAASGAPHPQA